MWSSPGPIRPQPNIQFSTRSMVVNLRGTHHDSKCCSSFRNDLVAKVEISIPPSFATIQNPKAYRWFGSCNASVSIEQE